MEYQEITKEFQIKNMVCPRCIWAVRDELSKLGFTVVVVELGKATVVANDSVTDDTVNAGLAALGFELLHTSRQRTVEQVKLLVLDLIYGEKLAQLNSPLSVYISEQIGKDYSSISTAFRAEEKLQLSRYIILQKIERTKELLCYHELTLSQIANRLGYKSVQHLSGQFKEVTGITPAKFLKEENIARRPICDLRLPIT